MAQEEDIKQNIIIEVKDSGVSETTKDINSLNTSITGTAEAQKKATTETQKAEQASKSFKAQMKEANDELHNAVQIYGETSQEAVKAAKGVAELKDQMGFAKDLADSFNPDQKFKALGASTQLAATGVSAVTSGLALFGEQGEDTEKTLLKVQAAMAFSQSISQLSELGDQWKILNTAVKGNTIFQKANAVSTVIAAGAMKLLGKGSDESSKGFKVLKGAIIGTGIGALIVGIGLLINNFDKVKKVVLNFVPGLASVGDTIMNIVDSVTDFLGLTSEADRVIDRIKKNADTSIALNKKFLAEHGSQLDEFTKQKIAAKDEYNEALKEDGANQIALAQELNRKLAAIEYSRGDEQRKIQEENAKKAKEARERQAEKDRQEAKDKAEKNAQDFRDFQKVIGDAEIEDRLQQRENRIEEEKSLSDSLNALSEQNAIADEERRIKDLEADKSALEQKKAIETAKVNIASQAISLLKDIFGKSKAVQKAAIIAEGAIGIGKMVASNNAANIGALATPQAILTSGASAVPVIALNNVSTGIGIASTVAATAKALSAVGGGSAPSAGALPSAPSRNAPQVGFQASSENQIATSINKNQGEQQPIKAFVVSHEVTTQQEFDKIKELNNKI